MARTTLLSIVALASLGSVLGIKSIYDVYPPLRQATDEWRCPIFHDSHITTDLSVIKAGQCSHMAVVDQAKGPALSWCDIGGGSSHATCDYEQSISYTQTWSTMHGVTGEWTFSAEYSGSFTESAGNTSGQTLGWRNLEPGYICVPKISYLKVSCAGIVYKDTPWTWGPALGGYMYIEKHNTDSSNMGSVKTIGVTWQGWFGSTMSNPGVVALNRGGSDPQWKMNDNYRNIWSRGSIDFPVLDSQGQILSVYGLDMVSCASANGMTRLEDGYLERPAAAVPEAGRETIGKHQ
ncbi:uncharacterized protein BDW70DRAFT_146783 [Aspergillus foveolatus]|uniref:uncharacterized protein n=1 Tax=Aspergillus foveolatus TaxID=210207 RepID=UPI003CCDA4F5